MALSGSYDFTLTRDDIINRTLRILKVVGQDSTPTANQYTNAALVLNAMFKEWRADKKRMLWTVEWLQLPLTASSVVVGTDGNDYECILNHTSVTATDKPITGSVYKGVWKATGGTGSGSVWANTTSYTSIHQVTLNSRIIGFESIFTAKNYSEQSLTPLTFTEYLAMSDKTTEGAPTHVCLKRDSSSSILYLYPRPDSTNYIINVQSYRLLQDFDGATNNPDAIVEWFELISFGLAERLMYEYNLPSNEKSDIISMAMYLRDKVFGGDNESIDYLRLKPRVR